MGPLISVIVTVYNIEQYLPACIDSIIDQTYHNLEILLVDDGSTDHSPVICDTYKKKDSRIQVIHKQNGGLSEARNTGIDLASGEFVSFIDGDDFIHRDFYRILMKIYQKTKCPVVECKNRNFINDADIRGYGKTGKAGVKVISRYEWLTETKLRGFLTVVVWNKIYKKYLFDNVRFPAGRLHEDIAATYQLVYLADKVARVYLELYYYRKRNNSISNQLSARNFEDQRWAYLQKIDYFQNLGEKTIADFTIAKYCITVLISEYKFSDEIRKRSRKSIRREVVCYYDQIKSDLKVPIKYKLYIKSFILAPFLFEYLEL